MKKLTLFILLFLFVDNVQLSRIVYLDKPLFNPNIKNNDFKPGNYIILRSYRKSTQLFISRNYNKQLLYHDYNNIIMSGIKSYSYSSYQPYVQNCCPISESEFIEKVKNTILFGCKYKNATIKYYGIKDFLKDIREDKGIIVKIGATYTIILKNKKNNFKLIFNSMTNFLSIRINLYKKNSDMRTIFHHYIYIKDTKDRYLRKILNDFSLDIEEMYIKKKS